MIYINFVELHSLMFHAKFQNHRPSGSKEDDHLYKLTFPLPEDDSDKVWL